MGLLRFLLALAVIDTHSSQLYPFVMVPANYAVEGFFVISGFYMALILREKYALTSGGYTLFITNRLLRIFPAYWTVLVLSLLVYAVFWQTAPLNNPISSFIQDQPGMPASILLLFTNVFIFGLDIVYFLQPYLNMPYVSSAVPQAWSISIELVFYLCAPFVVRIKTVYLLLFFMAGAVARLWMMEHHMYADPWNYRLLPLEFMFFFLGIFSYRIYARIKDLRIPAIVPAAFLMAIMFLILLCRTDQFRVFIPEILFQPKGFTLMAAIFFVVLWAGIPFIFAYTKNNRFDRWVGELSYPVYITHFLVIYLLSSLNLNRIPPCFYGWTVVGLSIIASIALVRFVIRPIEHIREDRVLKWRRG